MECGVEERRLLRSGLHREQLTEYMIKSYDNRTGLADVTLHCKDAVFHAHRIVLSHYSTFFKQLFESLAGVLNHFDVFLEGFSTREIEVSLLFMYTGGVVCYAGENTHSFINVANALHIPSLCEFLTYHYDQSEERTQNDKLTSPVGVWEKCESNPDHAEIIEQATSSSSRDDSIKDSDKHDAASGSLRRKQARPQRHAATPSPVNSPEPVVVDEDEDDTLDDTSDEELEPEELDSHESVRSPSPENPEPEQTHAQRIEPAAQPAPPPPNFLFLRNMINSPGGASFYSPPHFLPPPPQVGEAPKRVKDKVLWGKILKHQHFHASSRAQHSAPRGGPPRAWSNQDLTEALHNVWNKKMTTSQASRIFGIPYNSLLMYVRGKYGKSLKLDLLKKGLDLALLEKQKQAAMANERERNLKPHHHGFMQEKPNERIPTGQNNNVVEWMIMNNSTMSGGPNLIPKQEHPICFANRSMEHRK